MQFTGHEWSKETPTSHIPTGHMTEPDKFEVIHLGDPKDNQDICDEATRASTGWASELGETIKTPSQAHLPTSQNLIRDLDNQTKDIMVSAEVEWSDEHTPHAHTRKKNLDADDCHSFDDGASQTSTWWLNRFSTQWRYAFGTEIATPSQVHFSDETPHNNTLRNLDRSISLTGRKGKSGFEETKKLLADKLMDRVASMNGIGHHTQSRSCEDLTQDRQFAYEKAAEAFIECAKNLILESEGPNQRVDDWMIMGFIDKKYTLPADGEKKPHLYGEWEYLWSVDKDDIAMAKTQTFMKSTRPRPRGGKNRSCYPEDLIPTAEDWKWWCGEWKKVPGAIWEWKPTEEIWPWQRRFWTETHLKKRDMEFEKTCCEDRKM